MRGPFRIDDDALRIVFFVLIFRTMNKGDGGMA
jgi:hypothetical protein